MQTFKNACRIVYFELFFIFLFIPRMHSQVNTFTLQPDNAVFESVTERGYVQFKRTLEITPENVFDKWGNAFNIVSPLAMHLKDTISDTRHQLHYRFQQTFNGMPVYSGYYIIHYHEDGRVSGNGKIINPQEVNTRIILSESEALAKLLNHVNAKKYYWQDSIREAKARKKQNNPLATYYPKASLEYMPDKDRTAINLCYAFHIYCIEGGRSGKYYVDAGDGNVLKFLPAEHVCSSTTFASNFNGNQGAHTLDVGDEFELEDDCFNSVYGVYDAQNDDEIFTDAGNTWVTDRQRSAATSLWAVRQAYLNYDAEFNHQGHDDDDGNIDIYQGHVFAIGGNNNASFHYDEIGDDEINVGIGSSDAVTNDWNTLDLMGHEFTHGVDQYSAALEYEGESGALDESFADIFGEWIEYRELGNNDWFIGAERVNNNNCPTPLRYLVDPAGLNIPTGNNCQSDFDQPNTYGGTNWYPINGCDPNGDTDNCGVHTNSGVQNQMFYLLVEGGSGFNNGNTCHTAAGGYAWEVSGIGMEDAIEIGYFAHTVFLGPTSDYADAREAWVVAATSLFGECSNQAIQTGKAWYAVGLDPPIAPPQNLCNVTYGAVATTIEHPSSIETLSNCYVTVTNTGNLVQFKAGTAVVLRRGFNAETGSLFKALTTDCDFSYY